MAKHDKESYKYWILGLSILLLLILIVAACTCSEQFTQWAKDLGYPRPQGNLPNFQYGTKKDARQKEVGQWKRVGKEIPSSRLNIAKMKEKFGKKDKKFKMGMGVPMSKTVLV